MQGYLLKKSSGIRKEWKRRFFVLDSLGMLYYFSNKARSPDKCALCFARPILRRLQPVLGRALPITRQRWDGVLYTRISSCP